jgi:PAS domain S-box-containing protein
MVRSNPPPAFSQPVIVRYGIAILSVVVALGLALFTQRFGIEHTPFLMAIAVTVWFTGNGPGFFAIVLSILTLDYFFLPPLYHLELTFAHVPQFAMFGLVALVVASVSATRRRIEQELREARDELESKVAERTAELLQTTAEAVAAQQRFGDLVNSIEGIVWEADASSFQFSFVSQQAERILGYPVKRWLSEPTFWKDHLHPDDREWAVQLCVTATAEQRDHDFEYRMLAADGSVVWLRDLVTVVVEADRATRLRGVMLDVTKRRQAEAAQREQASLLNLTHDSVFVRDMSNLITFWNRGAEELYGWKPQDAVGKTTHGLLQTVFPLPLEQIEAELLNAGRWEGELVHTKADGTPVVVASRWALQRDEQDRPVAVLETNNDITEKKGAEEALRRQANLLEQAHDAILVWGLPGTIVYWNHGAEQLYGFSREEAIGRLSHDLLQTEHPVTTKQFELLIERHGTWTGQLTHTRRDGRKIAVESRQVLVHEAEGRRLVLETNRDISERMRAEEALRQAQADLAHVSRVNTLGELTASLAHEVNQPIAAAVTNANTCLRWLTREHPDVEEARQAASRIVKDATRAAEIISRIRALFKKAAPERELVDVNELIREMIVLLHAEASRSSISIRTELAADTPKITADRVQLQQVFMNLMLNGIDAMKIAGPPGEVTIRSQQNDDGELLISVSDTGVGLPKDRADQIFNAFFTTKPQGTGLGLTISRSIVESHGGRLWATANAGRGTTFHLALPTKPGRE